MKEKKEEILNETKTKIKDKLTWKNFNKILFSLIVVSILYYVTGINDLTVKGFRLQELKNDVAKLREENKKVKVSVMELESYNNLSEKAKTLDMVAVGEEIDYLVVGAGASAVAKR